MGPSHAISQDATNYFVALGCENDRGRNEPRNRLAIATCRGVRLGITGYLDLGADDRIGTYWLLVRRQTGDSWPVYPAWVLPGHDHWHVAINSFHSAIANQRFRERRVPVNTPGDQRRRFGTPAAWLALALVSVGAISCLCGYAWQGFDAILAASLALAVSLASGLGSLAINARLNQPELALYQVLVNLALRAGVPLGICFFVYWRDGILVEAGFVFYVMALYLTTIAIDALQLTSRFKTLT